MKTGRRKKQIDGIKERYFIPAEKLPLIMSNQENGTLEKKMAPDKIAVRKIVPRKITITENFPLKIASQKTAHRNTEASR